MKKDDIQYAIDLSRRIDKIKKIKEQLEELINTGDKYRLSIVLMFHIDKDSPKNDFEVFGYERHLWGSEHDMDFIFKDEEDDVRELIARILYERMCRKLKQMEEELEKL